MPKETLMIGFEVMMIVGGDDDSSFVANNLSPNHILSQCKLPVPVLCLDDGNYNVHGDNGGNDDGGDYMMMMMMMMMTMMMTMMMLTMMMS